jgi:hypothetical protein
VKAGSLSDSDGVQKQGDNAGAVTDLRERGIGKWAGSKLNGPVNGPSIEDLFSHSYIPPAKSSNTQELTSRWSWVAAARVWDPKAEQFQARASEIRKFGAQAKFLRRVQPSSTDRRSFVEVVKATMERKILQGRDGKDGDRPRDFDRSWGRRDEFQERREGREIVQGRRDPQGRLERDSRPNRQNFRDSDQRSFQGRKRIGEAQDERDVRRMTEEDLKHRIEDCKRNVPPQQQWGSSSGQFSGHQMKCFNCNDYGHHNSMCTRPPFCYSCRDVGHKSAQCPLMKSNKGLRLCSYGMPGQIFYALDVPESKNEGRAVIDTQIRALIFGS